MTGTPKSFSSAAPTCGGNAADDERISRNDVEAQTAAIGLSARDDRLMHGWHRRVPGWTKRQQFLEEFRGGKTFAANDAAAASNAGEKRAGQDRGYETAA